MELRIKKPKSSTIPTRWGAVYWEGEIINCQLWRSNGSLFSGGIKQITCRSGQFMSELDESIPNNETYWIAGWRMYDMLCCAGIYQAISSGMVHIRQKNRRYEKTDDKQDNSKLYGSLICENPPTIVDIRLLRGGRVKFLDLLNWGITMSMIGDENSESGLQDTIQAIQDYVSLVKTYNMGQLKQTAASQGFYAFRSSHLNHEVYANDDAKSRQLERASYYAGRCEARQLGKLPGRIWHLDVTAMYSFIGQDHKFPVRQLPNYARRLVPVLAEVSNLWQYIADVTISTPNPLYPVRWDKKVIWPVGEFRTTLAWPELRLALASGHVTNIHAVTKYLQEPIFESWSKWYFETLANLDKDGLAHMRPALKLAVNCTYGKIGQRTKNWVDLPSQSARAPFDQWWQTHPENGTPVQFRSIDGLVQYLDEGGESPVSVPSISATMTSYGRVMLADLLRIAGVGNAYYYDTDGIMVNDAAKQRFESLGYIHPTKPGKLKIREVSDDVTIYGIKHYSFGGRYVCAGVPLELVQLDEEKASYARHEGFNENLWHRRAFLHAYHIANRRHEQRYLHGAVSHDKSISPFRMGLIEGDSDGTGDASDREQVYGVLGHQGLSEG